MVVGVTERPCLLVPDRLGRVERSLVEIRKLPLGSIESFQSDSRNVWTAESCLRRSLEALLDIGRHLVAKLTTTGVAGVAVWYPGAGSGIMATMSYATSRPRR